MTDLSLYTILSRLHDVWPDVDDRSAALVVAMVLRSVGVARG